MTANSDPVEERDIQKVLGTLDDVRVQNKIMAIIGSRMTAQVLKSGEVALQISSKKEIS